MLQSTKQFLEAVEDWYGRPLSQEQRQKADECHTHGMRAKEIAEMFRYSDENESEDDHEDE